MQKQGEQQVWLFLLCSFAISQPHSPEVSAYTHLSTFHPGEEEASSQFRHIPAALFFHYVGDASKSPSSALSMTAGFFSCKIVWPNWREHFLQCTCKSRNFLVYRLMPDFYFCFTWSFLLCCRLLSSHSSGLLLLNMAVLLDSLPKPHKTFWCFSCPRCCCCFFFFFFSFWFNCF